MFVPNNRTPRAAGRLQRTPWLYALLLFVGLPRSAPAQDLDGWLGTEQVVARNRLVGNVLSNGAVIASPSKDEPNYYFHWVRDGALTMDVVVTLYTQSRDPAERGRYFSLLQAHLDFCLRVCPNNFASKILTTHREGSLPPFLPSSPPKYGV